MIGKSAPIRLDLVAEYSGKLFWNVFGKQETIKPHFFLHGYASEDFSGEDYDFTPVQFTGSNLEACAPDVFEQGHIIRKLQDSRFQISYSSSYKVTFSEECPVDYRGKTMILPSGFYPVEFLPSGELLLRGMKRVCVLDHTFKIIAKLSIKGEIADVSGNYLLVTTGDSFCGYYYEPNAKIYIYKVVKK